MTDTFKVACVQTNSGPDVDANVAAARALGFDARDAGADLIAFPETVSVMQADKAALREKAGPEDRSPALASFRELARETGAWVLVGSMAIEGGPGGKMANRSLLIDGGGEIKARYDKIHMFDVDLGGNEMHRESAYFEPGGKAVVAETPWGGLGMTVCYDLRFSPSLPDAGPAGREIHCRAVGLHPPHRRSPLACLGAGQGDRKRLLCFRPRPVRRSRRR